MFGKKRKEIVLSESTLVVFRGVEKVMRALWNGQDFEIVHASIQFKGDSCSNTESQTAIIHVLTYSGTSRLDPRIEMRVRHLGGCGDRWFLNSSSVRVWFANDEPFELGVVLLRNGFTPCTQIDEAKLTSLQRRFKLKS